MNARIITHNGRFHADEIMATAMISTFANICEKIRTRDKEIIFKYREGEEPKVLNFVIDVGGKYNPDNLWFDHHQQEFNDTYNEKSQIPLSSCGLIYKHFKNEIWSSIVGHNVSDELMDNFYFEFVLPLDANDNGVNQFPPETKTKFHQTLTLMNAIARLNNPDVNDEEKQMEFFNKSLELCKLFLAIYINHKYNKYFEMERDAPCFLEELRSTEGEILCLTDSNLQNIPYLLKKYDTEGRIKFYICSNSNVEYRVCTVSKGNFVNKIDLISEGEAKAKIGEGIKFVHKGKFLGVANDYGSALKLAQISLNKHKCFVKRTQRFISKVYSYFPNRSSSFVFLGGITAGIGLSLLASYRNN